MNDDDTRSEFDRILAASGGLETLIAELRQQTRETQAAIRATREREEVRFKQAMTALFQEQQRRTEMALRPKIARAWQALVVLAGVGVLVFGGFLLLLGRANDRLRVAEARADAAEVRAEVREASRHVEITSCGGRPCIRIDRNAPTWKRGSGEYILVDGKPGKETGKRR
ncbi:hypothetical protein [Solilutibacter pythonis]|uniref:hypothetical protein n=1 Tax=Solilutibacter pythonis TaxID=2483112 RepID=UPI001FE82D4D|nr:hypothetical protein [Lysobacter pythonis]